MQTASHREAKMQVIIYSDSGHGWAKVARKLIDQLQLSISSYSYQRGAYVYLEEDCDLSKFCVAYEREITTYSEPLKRWVVKPITFKELHTNKTSKIRGYESYRGW